eukprot:COSAG06_NODE_584_length_14005_cov_23.423486_11_plen_139_part_00
MAVAVAVQDFRTAATTRNATQCEIKRVFRVMLCSKRSFYPDRLGTNTGNTQKKMVSLQAECCVQIDQKCGMIEANFGDEVRSFCLRIEYKCTVRCHASQLPRVTGATCRIESLGVVTVGLTSSVLCLLCVPRGASYIH